MIIHWAGKGSNVIVAMTRDIKLQRTSYSNVYISRDYGASYSKTRMQINSTQQASFDKFYNSPVFNSHVSNPIWNLRKSSYVQVV